MTEADSAYQQGYTRGFERGAEHERARLLKLVESLATSLVCIPDAGSNAFVRGARAAGRRVKKLACKIRQTS